MHAVQNSRILKVLTINIWNRQGPWEQRLPMIRDAIARLEPDIIGVQEVIHGAHDCQAQQLAAGFDYECSFGEARGLGHEYGYGNALLSRYPITREEVIALPCAELEEPRSVLLNEVHTPAGTLPVMVTHLAWQFHHGFIREQQVAAIGAAIEQHVPVGDDCLPAVVMGDFNAGPDTTEMRYLLGLHALNGRSMYLADCFGETGEGPGYTFDPRHNPFAGLTYERPRRIDFVLVRGPDHHGRGKPLHAEVVMTEVVDGVAPSDHYGVYAEIRMSGR